MNSNGYARSAPQQDMHFSTAGNVTSASSSRSSPDAVEGRCCEVCLKWYCLQDCKHVEDLASVVPGAGASQQKASTFGRVKSADARVQCCNKCSQLFKVKRWQRERVRGEPYEALDGLAETSRKLLKAYDLVHTHLNLLHQHLAQMDGLARSAEIPGALHDEFCRQELLRGLEDQRAKVTDTLAVVEAALQSLSRIECAGAGPREARLRDALLQHIRKQLEVQKPRISAVLARADAIPTSPGEMTPKTPAWAANRIPMKGSA